MSIIPGRRARTLKTLSPSLANLALPHLVDLVFGIGRALLPAHSDLRRTGDGTADPLALAAVLSTGTLALEGWPDSFRAGIKALANGADLEQARSMALVQRMGNPANVPQVIADLVREAVPALFLQRRKSLRHLAEPMVDPVAFMRSAGISFKAFRLLKDSPVLGDTMSTGVVRTSIQIPKGTADEVAAALRNSEDFIVLAARLGMPHYAVEQLIQLNEVDRLDHRVFETLGRPTQLTRASAKALIDDLLENRTAKRSGDVPLADAMKRFGGEKPWGAHIAAMRRQKIRYHMAEREMKRQSVRPAEYRIWVDSDQIAELIVSPRPPTSHAEFLETHIPQRDALEILNVGHGTLTDASNEGLLDFIRRGKALVADRQRVLELAVEFISVVELAALLGISSQRLSVLEHRSGIGLEKKLLGWTRADVMSDMPRLRELLHAQGR